MLGSPEMSVWHLVQILAFLLYITGIVCPISPYQVRYGDTHSGIKSSGFLMEYKITLYTFFAITPV